MIDKKEMGEGERRKISLVSISPKNCLNLHNTVELIFILFPITFPLPHCTIKNSLSDQSSAAMKMYLDHPKNTVTNFTKKKRENFKFFFSF